MLSALGYRTIDDYLADPERARVAAQVQTDFDLPMLSVDTTDGYDPSRDSIVEWIVDETRAPRAGVEFGGSQIFEHTFAFGARG